MKRRSRILCLLVSVLVVFAMLPLQASTATNYEKAFDKLTYAKALKYDKAPPTKVGKVQTAKEINKTLKSIGYFKDAPGKGSVLCDKYLSLVKVNGVVLYFTRNAQWTKTSGSSSNLYWEKTKMDKVEGTMPTYCSLQNRIGVDSKYWTWKKYEATGSKGEITDSSPLPSSKKPKMVQGYSTFRKYKDVKVLGEPCFVFSIQTEDSTDIFYYYVSRKTGVELMSIRCYSQGNYHAVVHFVYKRISNAPGDFIPPKKIWS